MSYFIDFGIVVSLRLHSKNLNKTTRNQYIVKIKKIHSKNLNKTALSSSILFISLPIFTVKHNTKQNNAKKVVPIWHCQ